MKLKRGAIVAIITVSSTLLIAVIGVIVMLYMKNDPVTQRDESTEESTEEPTATEAPEVLGNDYFDSVESQQFELIHEEQVDRVIITKEVDYESAYPAYLQELVEPWEELRASLLPVIPTIQEEQNYSADIWQEFGYATSGYMYEQNYMCTLSTEIHYYKFIACLKDDTPEGKVDILVYRRIEVPEAE